jgi:hypothetical protein
MGSYPYPDNYLSPDPTVNLPAYPVRVACNALSDPTLSGWQLLAAAGVAAGVRVGPLRHSTPSDSTVA